MKTVAIIVDNGPSDGGTFQYNQCVVDAFNELPQGQFDKIVFYTNDYWKNYLQDYPYTFVELKLTDRLKKILKLITLLNLPVKLREALLYVLAPSVAKNLGGKIDLLIFPSQDTVSLFTTTRKLNVIHDLMHIYESHFPEVSQNGRTRYRDILFKSFCKESEAIIVDSKIGSIHVQESYNTPEEKIFQLPYIPPPHILDQKPVPADFDKRYCNLPERFLFYPGQFWPHKNHANLLTAAKILADSGTKVNLVFAGKKDYNHSILVEQIDKLRLNAHITFLDFVPNEYLKGIYLKASGLIMPTFFGPTNIPPLEAIFLDCPVAVSEIYGMQAQLQDAALYFDPKNAQDIADKMKTLWEDQKQREQLIKNGREVAQRWNKKAFNQKFKEIIEKSG